MEKEIHTYLTIENECVSELVIKRSKFIAHSFSVTYQEMVREKLLKIQSLYPNASHWCYAWRIGYNPPLDFFADAGEPHGTAGRPILGSILTRNLTNLLVIVTRYFGGKKLGVRGLINAYQQAAEMVLENSGAIEKELLAEFILKINPTDFQLMVNQLIYFCRGKKYLDILPNYGEIRFRILLQRLQETLSFLELKQREGFILNWERCDTL
ncbi:IMPACT family member YigZ [Atribacter laminatus]|uniref:IMPACT family member YigZ n=2 Tax=Atribacter laminatus TaxID=2847778 RepID=A0A7T1AKG6_ATRLM|nr:IMPACT family member YigZ [Atribacter laminatus]